MSKSLVKRAVTLAVKTAAAAVLTAGCGGTPEAGVDVAQDAAALSEHSRLERSCAELEQADRALSAATATLGSAEAFAQASTGGALLMPAGQYAKQGPDAIRAFLAANPLERNGTLTWQPVRWDVSDDGRVGYSFGFGNVEYTATDGTPALQRYKYLSAWEREPGGGWKLAAALPLYSVFDLQPLPAGMSSCHERRRNPSAREEVALERVMDTDRAFSAMAMESGSAGAFIHFAAEDVASLNGRGWYGKDVLRANSPPSSPPGLLSWEPVHGGASPSADLGWTVGAATYRIPQADGTVALSYSKYLSVWVLQADGSYRYVQDHGTSSPGPHGP
jgi:ketosteroid isomerase-like protein